MGHSKMSPRENMRAFKVAFVMLLVTFLAALSACTGGPAPIRARDVVEVAILPPPMGDLLVAPRFVLNPGAFLDSDRVFPISAIEDAIPDPLPSPPREHTGCSLGNRLMFVLKDGRNIIYGPCDTTNEIEVFDRAVGAKYVELSKARGWLK